MPPIHGTHPVSVKPISKATIPAQKSGPVFTPLDSMRRNKFRIPVLQTLNDMAPGCGMPLRTLAMIVAEIAGSKQSNLDYFCSNLIQTTLGYVDRSKTNRFEPTLLGLGYIASDEIEVEDGISETIYFITVLGRIALQDYELRTA